MTDGAGRVEGTWTGTYEQDGVSGRMAVEIEQAENGRFLVRWVVETVYPAAEATVEAYRVTWTVGSTQMALTIEGDQAVLGPVPPREQAVDAAAYARHRVRLQRTA
jgi:hypothetical protein